MNKLLPRSTMLGTGAASPYTIAAGVFVAICQVVNQLVVTPGTVRDVVTVVLAAAGAYGITPLFGPALTNILHIPANILFFVAAAISGANGVLAVLTMSATMHAVYAGILTLIGAVVFGSPILSQPTPAPTITWSPQHHPVSGPVSRDLH